MTLSEFRARFPILARRVYVNTCSQGALSIDVDEAMRAYLDSWHESGSPWEMWVEQVERLRVRFAASIGADSDEIAVMPSASAGINAVASSLTFDTPRSHVVVGDFEFPTMAQAWMAQERRGATIRRAHAASTSPDTLPLDAYDAVIDERTLIVPAAHVCFRNGHKTDIAGLTRLAHDRGAYILLDDYQRTGSGPIDVHALGVDFMVTGCLKYLLAAAGIGFLYVRRDLIERFEPTVTGWFGRVNPFAFRIDALDWPAGASRFETGTPPVPNAYAALAALELLERVGYETVGAAGRPSRRPVRGRRTRRGLRRCGRRPRLSAAARSWSSRASMAPRSCPGLPHAASSRRAAATGCGSPSTPTTPTPTSTRFSARSLRESSLLERATIAQ